MALYIRIEGKTESEIERLNSLVNLFEIQLLTYFKIFVGILLGPTTFRGLRDKVIFLNSVLFILLFWQEPIPLIMGSKNAQQ